MFFEEAYFKRRPRPEHNSMTNMANKLKIASFDQVGWAVEGSSVRVSGEIIRKPAVLIQAIEDKESFPYH
jgi:hypothetical protein